MSNQVLQWHPGFATIMEIELEDERDNLQFFREYNLTKKPLQMDILVIKLITERKIKKNIGRLFRRYNVVEYKNPNDYVSINDFYKVMAYACLYQADTEKVLEIDPDQLTITFVESRSPRKLLKYLKEKLGVGVSHPYPGIYYITELMFPIQIIVNTQLSKDENLWLSRLSQNLKAKEDIEPLAKAYKEQENNPLYAAAMDIIIRANKKEYEEGKDVCDALRELFADELEEKLAQGIRVVIDIYQSLGNSKEVTASNVQEKFQIPLQDAKQYVDKFWGE